MANQGLTHFDDQGRSRMVDVGEKPITARQARAAAEILLQPATLELIRNRQMSKGDVLEVARLAGIMAAKRTSDLIPLCHPLSLDMVEIHFSFPAENCLRIESTARVQARTGVEMESLTAVSVAALTVYDMCKSVDRGRVIARVQLVEKTGGKSGLFQNTLDAPDSPNVPKAERGIIEK